MSIVKFKGKRLKGLEMCETWCGFSAEDLERPGAALLVWLSRISLSRGHKMTEVASALGVTHGYQNDHLAQLPWPSARHRSVRDEGRHGGTAQEARPGGTPPQHGRRSGEPNG